jgi:transposase-like protein
MGRKDEERRIYPEEFKTETVAQAQIYEKPARQGATDLGINENRPCRWIRQTRTDVGTDLPPFPGHGTRNQPAPGRKSLRYGRRMKS